MENSVNQVDFVWDIAFQKAFSLIAYDASCTGSTQPYHYYYYKKKHSYVK